MLACAPPGPTRAETFTAIFETCTRPPCPLAPLGAALGEAVARSVPVVAASPGLVFAYDEATGAFVRQPAVSGQLFLERAEPLGRGRWNVGLSYQYVAVDAIDGHDVRRLHDDAPIRVPGGGAVTIPRFAVDLATHQETLSVSYGVGGETDLNLTVPALYSDLEIAGRFSGGDPFRFPSSKLGIGDVIVRGKHRVLHDGAADVAAGLALRLPSGSEGDFQGTGSVEVLPALFATTASIVLPAGIALQGFANAGFDFVTDDVDRSEGRYGVGVDARVRDRTALAVAVLARHSFGPIADAVDVPRAHGGASPLFGLDFGRADVVDLSLGGRVVLWGDALIAYANVIVPLTDDGVRSDAIPLAGLELAF